MKPFRDVLSCALLSASIACSSGGSVEIGESRTGEKLADYAASWDGYAEAYSFYDGSDRVRISLDALGNGTLEIGDSPTLPPASDPDAAYPPSDEQNPAGLLELLFPGFAYPIETASIATTRLRLVVSPWMIERDWCPMLTPYVWRETNTGPVYSCLPHETDAPANAPPDTCWFREGSNLFQADCQKSGLCGAACTCTASSCSVYEPEPGSIRSENKTQLDAALTDNGNTLVGTMLIRSQRVTVRLTRK